MLPVTLFKCLADDTRLKCLLLIAHHGSVCVCDLQQALALNQPKVSRHLAELRKCNLLDDQRQGKWIYYRLHPSVPVWAKEILSQVASNNPEYLQACHQRLNSITRTVCEN